MNIVGANASVVVRSTDGWMKEDGGSTSSKSSEYSSLIDGSWGGGSEATFGLNSIISGKGGSCGMTNDGGVGGGGGRTFSFSYLSTDEGALMFFAFLVKKWANNRKMSIEVDVSTHDSSFKRIKVNEMAIVIKVRIRHKM